MKRTIQALAALAVMGTVLVGCFDAKPSEFNIAYVLGDGEGDAREIKEIVMPGKRSDIEDDDGVQLVYGNARNFNIQEGNDKADSQVPLVDASRPSEDGLTPGVPIRANGIMAFALNRPADTDVCDKEANSGGCRALFAFYQYCQKYDCTLGVKGEGAGDDDPENQTLSSDAGWMKMLYEGSEQAIRHSWSAVIVEYGPEIENQRDKWPEIATKMMDLYTAEMNTLIGMPEGVNIFCSPTVIAGEKCVAPTWTFHSLSVVRSEAANSALVAQRDQELTKQAALDKIAADREIQTQQQALNEQKAADEAKLINTPGYIEAKERQAEIDKINACAAAAGKCVVIIGGGGATSTQLQVPVG